MLLSKFTLKHLKSKLSFVYNAPQFVNHGKPLWLHAKPEDQWSCKRSPVWPSKAQNIQNQENIR